MHTICNTGPNGPKPTHCRHQGRGLAGPFPGRRSAGAGPRERTGPRAPRGRPPPGARRPVPRREAGRRTLDRGCPRGGRSRQGFAHFSEAVGGKGRGPEKELWYSLPAHPRTPLPAPSPPSEECDSVYTPRSRPSPRAPPSQPRTASCVPRRGPRAFSPAGPRAARPSRPVGGQRSARLTPDLAFPPPYQLRGHLTSCPRAWGSIALEPAPSGPTPTRPAIGRQDASRTFLLAGFSVFP